MRIRTHPDGSVWIPRENRAIEDKLDLEMLRIPGELRWYPKVSSKAVDELFPLLEGQEINIVGKGPSLDRLSAVDLGGRVTFALNEAILLVSKLLPEAFGVVQDYGVAQTLATTPSRMIVNARSAAWFKGHPQLYTFLPQSLDLLDGDLTALVALKIGEKGGAVKANMLCFDAAVNGDLNYARAVGYEPTRGGAPKRFLEHRKRIETASKLPCNWALPA